MGYTDCVLRKLSLFTKHHCYRMFAHSWLACSIMFAYFLYINASSWESDSDCSRAVCSSQVGIRLDTVFTLVTALLCHKDTAQGTQSPTRGISYLSLCLYGIRVASMGVLEIISDLECFTLSSRRRQRPVSATIRKYSGGMFYYEGC